MLLILPLLRAVPNCTHFLPVPSSGLTRWSGRISSGDCAQLSVLSRPFYSIVAADTDLEVTNYINIGDETEIEARGNTSSFGTGSRVEAPPVVLAYAPPDSLTNISLTYGVIPGNRCEKLYMDSHVGFDFEFGGADWAAGAVCVLSAAPGVQTVTVNVSDCGKCPIVTIFSGLDSVLAELRGVGTVTETGPDQSLPLFVVVNGSGGEGLVRIRGTGDRWQPFRSGRFEFDGLMDYREPTPETTVEELGDVLAFLGAGLCALFVVLLGVYVVWKECKRRRTQEAQLAAVSIGPSGFTQTAMFVDQNIAD
jgi:hypothetical protein